MTDMVSEVTFIRSSGLNHRYFKAFLDEIENNMVTLSTTQKFVALAKARLCNVFYHY
jgi:hypothetical protein